MIRHAHRLAVIVLVVLAWISQASAVWAHASLIASEPANDAVLASSPSVLTLTFNETVVPLVMRIIDSTGAATNITGITQSGSRLVLSPPAPLADGAYVLNWRAASADGHPVGGAVVFAVGQRGAGVMPATQDRFSALHIAIWLTRWLIYIALFAGVGGAFFRAWIAASYSPQAHAPSARATRQLIVGVIGAGLVALVASVGLQGLDQHALALSALTRADIWASGMMGSFGVSAVLAGAAMLLALLSLSAAQVTARGLSLIALLGVGAALGASGHAAHASPRWLMTPAVAMHGMALAFWIGALIPLGLALREAKGEGERESGAGGRRILDTFSRWILLPVGILIASGVLLAVVQLERISALWTTTYGNVLLVKLALVAVLLMLASWNRWRLTPAIARGQHGARTRMRRAIVVEVVLVAAILGTVALWRFTPPPRALADGEGVVTMAASVGKVSAAITVTPDRAGRIRVTAKLTGPDATSFATPGVTLMLANETADIAPVGRQMTAMGDGKWQVEALVPVPGQWSLALDVLISDFESVYIETPLVIR